MTGNTKWLLAALLAATIFPTAAQAQYPYGGYGYGGFGWQSGYGQGVFRDSHMRPPFFALYPPVYYSNQIVRRPVGPSPFAYPSWYTPSQGQVVMNAEYRAPEPLVINNPFVKAKGTAAAALPANEEHAVPSEPASSRQVESLAPYRVDNPYVAGKD